MKPHVLKNIQIDFLWPEIASAVMEELDGGGTYLGEVDPQAVGNDDPLIAKLLDVGQEYGALGAIVSGSGPTVAFLVSDEEHGLDLAVALSSSGVVGSVTRAFGPVHGAKVIESH